MSERNEGGDCFKAGVDLLLKLAWKTVSAGGADGEGFYLCHGIVTGQGPIEGVRYSHCWVEHALIGSPATVLDHSNGRQLEMPAWLYYRIGRIDARKVYRYSLNEARRLLNEHKHYGPWDLCCPQDEMSHLIVAGTEVQTSAAKPSPHPEGG